MPQAILKSTPSPTRTLVQRMRLQGRLLLLGLRELTALLAMVAGLALGLVTLAEGMARLGL